MLVTNPQPGGLNIFFDRRSTLEQRVYLIVEVKEEGERFRIVTLGIELGSFDWQSLSSLDYDVIFLRHR